MLLTVDSDKIVRGFSFTFGKKWVPLLSLGENYTGSVWIIGAQEEEIYLIDLKGANQPVPFQKTAIKVHKYKIPLAGLKEGKKFEASKNEENILNNLYFINQDLWRLNNYKIYKDARSTKNSDHYYSDNLRDDDEIKERKKVHDKMILTLINESIIEKQIGKAESLFSFLCLEKSKVICINMCQQLNQTKLLESLNRKMMIYNYNSNKTNKTQSNENLQNSNIPQISNKNNVNTGESLFSQISVNIVINSFILGYV